MILEKKKYIVFEALWYLSVSNLINSLRGKYQTSDSVQLSQSAALFPLVSHLTSLDHNFIYKSLGVHNI